MPAQATQDEQLAVLTIISNNPGITFDQLAEKAGLTPSRLGKVISSPGNRKLFKMSYTQGEYDLTHPELPVNTMTYTLTVRGRYVLEAQDMKLKLTAADVINREFERLGVDNVWTATTHKYKSYGAESLSLTKRDGEDIIPDEGLREYPDPEQFVELISKLDSAACGSLDVIELILDSVQVGYSNGHSDGYSEGVSDGERHYE